MSDEVNWQQLAEGFRLERNIMQEMAMKAREAGRREGVEANERLIQDMAMLLRRMAHKHPDSLSASAAKFLHKHGLSGSVIREIDSPKAEGEKTE